jgi:hypothetical protein
MREILLQRFYSLSWRDAKLVEQPVEINHKL